MLADSVPSEAPLSSSRVATALTLRQLALAAIVNCISGGSAAALPPALAALLARWRAEPAALEDLGLQLRLMERPQAEDKPLCLLGAALGLQPLELVVVALLAAVEEEPLAARTIAEVQAPIPGSRPIVGLLSAAFASLATPEQSLCEVLLSGVAVSSGLIVIRDDDVPLSERRLALAPGLLLALRGVDGSFPGVSVGLGPAPEVPLPASSISEIARQSSALELTRGTLVVRSGSLSEARTVAQALARALGKRPAFLENPTAGPGIGAWLLARELLPIFSLELAPGERRRLPALPCYTGPSVAICGPDGAVETATGIAPEWTLPVPAPRERVELWQRAFADSELAHLLSRRHRHGAGRIAHLAHVARHAALLEGNAAPSLAHVEAAAWTVEGAGLGGLAQPLRDAVPEGALVTTPVVRQELDLLVLRCLSRDGLAEEFGPTLQARVKSGVRALFVGPSGTGKTLAAGWLATRLGKPLYRVDLAATTSKYIGETEKNLAQILARAEQAEVVLLFDEADSMFGRRTEIKDSNDRFANAQTNYLLQRLESYEGITILTSNSRARFDSAFSRRLDAIIEFSAPGPEQRRSLWQSHLGSGHSLAGESLNRLAAVADISGGHIRNTVIAAAVIAGSANRKVAYEDILTALIGEYRKLGLPVPQELRRKKPGSAP